MNFSFRKFSLLDRQVSCLLASMMLSLAVSRAPVWADEKLEAPLPPTATNAAVHYQRAILFLYAVDPTLRTVLQKPIWEIIKPASTDDDIAEIDRLLVESRHAIRSALVGADQTEADFGLDMPHYMVCSVLPHTEAMIDLAKLVTLHGMELESNGNWKEAGEVYLATLRMGRHMTHQTTLPEALAGVEMLETGYYALGHWAPRCPDPSLVKDALDLVSTMASNMVDPARTLQSEATILEMRLEAMQDAFPDGPWAEMILESLGEEMPTGGAERLRQAAIEAATKHGVPQEAFQDKESFTQYVRSLNSASVTLAKESALCLCHRSPESIRLGERVFGKYQSELKETGDFHAQNPAKIAALFTVHEAELTLTRVILAISASRTAEGFPSDLKQIADTFGGQLPHSPYDGSELNYELLDNGAGFSVRVKQASVGDTVLPEMKFAYLPSKSDGTP